MNTILSGDVGGTNTRLAILQPTGGRFAKLASRTAPSVGFAGLQDAINALLDRVDRPCPKAAAFGIAGPVVGNRCEATNIPWIVDADELKADFGFQRVALLNDLEAQAQGIQYLRDEDFEVLHPGTAKPGNRALIAAGTGLGQAGLFFDGEQHRVFATEGGHTDFAPRNDLQIALLQYLTRRYGRGSWERVLSGPGLEDMFRFLVEDRELSPHPELGRTPDAATISNAALEGRCEVADRALDLFVELYGAEAGNLALKILAINGLFVGGGIAPRILERLKGPLFLQSFRAKGRMSSLVQDIPVRVILDGDCALYGAAGAVVDPA